MKPIDLENAILRKLARASGANGSDGMTITRLYRSLAPATGQGPIWRQVANAVYRLERQGLVNIVGDELQGTECHPLFAINRAGQVELGKLIRKPEDDTHAE